METLHDKRLHAVRPDLADVRLQGTVAAERFVAGTAMQVTAAVADVLSRPAADAGLLTQFLRGDRVSVFEERDGWAWLQGEGDGYVGYVAADALTRDVRPPTHVVSVPRTFVYSGADLRLPRMDALSLGSAVAIVGEAETRGTSYAVLDNGGTIVLTHLAAVEQTAADYVAVAEALLRTPYLWGGTSGFGIDCSGLVQLAMRMTGRNVLRDTDMQEAIGRPVERGELARGDLMFWKGHVAVMTDAETIIHANGHTMSVSLESLDEAVVRIGYLYGQPTGYRRP